LDPQSQLDHIELTPHDLNFFPLKKIAIFKYFILLNKPHPRVKNLVTSKHDKIAAARP
jgi:hypothetical protein